MDTQADITGEESKPQWGGKTWGIRSPQGGRVTQVHLIVRLCSHSYPWFWVKRFFKSLLAFYNFISNLPIFRCWQLI